MDRETAWEAMIAAIREETENPDAEIEPGMTAIDVPGWDSLAHVRIVMNMEARTGAVVEMSDTYKAATVGELCDIVIKSFAKANGA
ncbi:MAG: acyl carrier protein [Caulobacteraceae bacterium]|nr:acyl carrier protein [Caulobacteraceae bacterium]